MTIKKRSFEMTTGDPTAAEASHANTASFNSKIEITKFQKTAVLD